MPKRPEVLALDLAVSHAAGFTSQWFVTCLPFNTAWNVVFLAHAYLANTFLKCCT